MKNSYTLLLFIVIILFAIGNTFINEPSIILYIANLLPLALFTYYIKVKGFAFLKPNNPYNILNLILWIGAWRLAVKSFNYLCELFNYTSANKFLVDLFLLVIYFTLLKLLIKKPVQVH